METPAGYRYSIVYNFKGTAGPDFPVETLTPFRGVLYGTTKQGGLYGCAAGCGTVYAVTPSGVEKVLHKFVGPSGGQGPYRPICRLVVLKGVLFGTTTAGGAYDNGAIFQITTSGKERTLYSFRGGADGSGPHSLTVGGGLLYGTTQFGGKSGCNVGGVSTCGTVFSISPTGQQHRVLYAFKGGSDGSRPIGDLLDLNGALYGTTVYGGTSNSSCSSGCGTVFKLTTAGQETVLHRFKDGNDGAYPLAGLTSLNGALYGTTQWGGGLPTSSSIGSGIVFEITPSGHESVVYRFKGAPDGEAPQIGSLEPANGYLYGTTEYGGLNSCCGVLFKLSTSGEETIEHDFTNYQDGGFPYGGLAGMNGFLYGTTSSGGDHGTGTVFRFKPSR